MQWVFVRHLEVEKGSPAELLGQKDAPLTARGTRQVPALATRLAERYRIGRLYSSPLIRCRALALEVARKTGLVSAEDSRLMEIHWGAWEGNTLEAIYAADPRADLLRPPGGEPIERFAARVRGFLADLEKGTFQGETTLVVTHGGVIRMLVLEIFGLPFERFWDLRVEYGGAAEILVHPDGRKRLAGLNRFWQPEGS